MANLNEAYKTTIRTKLSEELGIKNPHAVPGLVKIAVNIGTGDMKGDQALQKNIADNLALITGQKAVMTRAKKAIAGFKIRENDHLGYRVTLRGQRMYDFLDRLITYVFPRLRDFQGEPLKGFDKQGNYSFGLKEHTVFPEVPYQGNEKAWGMQITLVTTAKNKDDATALLKGFGFPFEKKDEVK